MPSKYRKRIPGYSGSYKKDLYLLFLLGGRQSWKDREIRADASGHVWETPVYWPWRNHDLDPSWERRYPEAYQRGMAVAVFPYPAEFWDKCQYFYKMGQLREKRGNPSNLF